MELQFTTVDRVLAKVHRDLKGIDLNETDAIEWIGEALEFLKVPQVQDQAVAFIEVNNYEADLPQGFQMVLQIAKNNQWKPEEKNSCCLPKDIIEQVVVEEEQTTEDCDECYSPFAECYQPYFDMQWQYINWTTHKYYKEEFTPVRLANNTLFNSIVCKEINHKDIYENCGSNIDEYTIVGTTNKKLRFSFKEGYIAMAYIKNAIDNETGYPLIPDNISYVTAITYYLKWKMAEMMTWNGREGFARLAQDNERLWLKYARQGKNYMKMPKSIDQFQNLLEQSHYLIPRHRRYYGFFGNLGREENRNFNDPDFRRRMRFYYTDYNRYGRQ